MENHHLQWIFPLKMVIFHSYVSLPEGIGYYRHITYLHLLTIIHQVVVFSAG